MANPIRPTIVIISGGWHQPITYSKLTRALEHAGFEVVVPALPSVNDDRPPTKDIHDDTTTIRNAVTSLCDAGKQVIALMHSYGGQVGTIALADLGRATRSTHDLPGGVVQLVYMTASALLEGQCMMDKVEEHGHLDLMPQAFDIADDMSVTSRFPRDLLVGPGVSDAEADEYVATWKRWNARCMYQKIDHCAWRNIPVTYLYCASDMTLPIYYQTSMTDALKKEGVEVDTFTLETGHCPNLTATNEVVAAIEKVADKCVTTSQ